MELRHLERERPHDSKPALVLGTVGMHEETR